MTSAAFKSTTKSSPIAAGGGRAEDEGSSSRNGIHRRTRSLSRHSGRFVPADSDGLRDPPSGRFVNMVRGSGFPEVSLDDLANELFPEKEADGEVESRKVGGRLSDFHSRMETESSKRRGRSVSRKESFESSSGNKGVSDSSSLRRRRSVSSARYRCSDSESYSSVVTDDEVRDSRSRKSGAEKTIRPVYASKRTEHPVGDGEGTGLYEAMCKEVIHAVEDIRIELKKVMADAKPSEINDASNLQSKGSDAVQAITEMRRTYTTKLEESEKRKQELLTELAAEEERRQKLTKIVRDLLPEPKRSAAASEKPLRVRRKSNDKTRMSKQLNEEAEKYFEDFISNVEDTDISSFDGERSDTSSTMGGSTKSKVPVMSSAVSERRGCLSIDGPLPFETDGIVLPWLEWETSYGGFSPNSKSKTEVPGLPSNHLLSVERAATSTFDDNNYTTSGHGSWSPNNCDDNSSSAVSREKSGSRFGEVGSCLQTKSNGSSFDMGEYMHLQHSEDLLYERLRQRHRIDSGSLILCGRSFI